MALYPHIYIYIYTVYSSTYEQYRALKNRDNSRILKGNRYPRMLYREHVVVGTVRVPLARSIAAEVSLVRRWRTSSRFIKPRPLSDFASCRPPRYYSPARSLWFPPAFHRHFSTARETLQPQWSCPFRSYFSPILCHTSEIRLEFFQGIFINWKKLIVQCCLNQS